MNALEAEWILSVFNTNAFEAEWILSVFTEHL